MSMDLFGVVGEVAAVGLPEAAPPPSSLRLHSIVASNFVAAGWNRLIGAALGATQPATVGIAEQFVASFAWSSGRGFGGLGADTLATVLAVGIGPRIASTHLTKHHFGLFWGDFRPVGKGERSKARREGRCYPSVQRW
jgi:hypothetical protein